jgi:hypothetical protein
MNPENATLPWSRADWNQGRLTTGNDKKGRPYRRSLDKGRY